MKPITDHPEYLIAVDSSIWSKKSSKWLKQYLANGHLCVWFYNHHVKTYHSVSRLVLETFIGPCPKGMICRHLDGNKQNNDLTNLAWGTPFENVQDTLKQNEKAYNRKFTRQQIRDIRQSLAAGATVKNLAACCQVDRLTIRNIKKRKTYREV